MDSNLSYVISILQGKLRMLPLNILSLVTLISMFGILILYSAAGGNWNPWAYKQLCTFLMFLPISIIIALIDLRIIFRYAFIPYILVMVLLILVEAFGITAMGGKRWIEIGSIRLQPAELAKIAIVLFLAKYFHQLPKNDIDKTKSLIIPLIAIFIPIALVIKQPDLGTGLLTLMVSAVVFFAFGVSIWKFLVVGISALAIMPLVWSFLYDYQKKRVMVFLNPELDPLDSGYNIIQSKIAIGSGGFWGKGIAMGTQSLLSFLPEHQTDFIFATLTENLGFVGGFILLVLYFLLLISSLAIAINARSVFGKLIAVGIAGIFFFHAFINISMVMGMAPVVGIPLPLISYGGTMMASMLCGFGLIMNIHINKHLVISSK